MVLVIWVVVNGSMLRSGPIIDTDYIQDFLVFDVDVMEQTLVQSYWVSLDHTLNAITSVTPGSVQILKYRLYPRQQRVW